MASTKRLRSVVHSIGHHAISGLCYVHPHSYNTCNEASINQISINLLKEGFKPDIEDISEPLKASANGLRNKFYEILSSEDLSSSELESAEITFIYHHKEWPFSCHVEVHTI